MADVDCEPIHGPHIDNCIFSDYVLTSYPGFLVLGKPIYTPNLHQFAFAKNSYIKIFVYMYDEWIQLLKKCIKHNLKIAENKISKTDNCEFLICETRLATMKCVYINDIFLIQMHSNFENLKILEFSFNLYELVNFYKAFQTLFFTPLVIEKPVNFTLQYILSEYSLEFLKNINYHNVVNLTKNVCLLLTHTSPDFSFLLAEIIMRHKTLIIQNAQLLAIIP